MLGPNSIVLRECEVGSPEVPHGTLDLVAGKMDKDQPYSVAVTIDSEEFMVTDLVGLEAKSPQTMRVRAISELVTFTSYRAVWQPSLPLLLWLTSVLHHNSSSIYPCSVLVHAL